MVMVQDPATAAYDSMPLAAIKTNMVDYVLPPEEMPLKLIQYVNHPILSENVDSQDHMELMNSHALQKVLMLLRSHTGHDFSMYKTSTVVRRIERRIAYHQLPDLGYYVDYLREHPHEIDSLFNELLIGVTKFFRDIEAFESLKTRLSILLGNKDTDEPVRIWTVGCSTGEEAYSIAMIVSECLSELKRSILPRIQIFATDLDMEAIERARTGCYRENIAADVSEERLNRFFIRKDQFYFVKKELREMIVFAQHNMIKDAPFTKLDLVTCRNVMIYLTAELQKKIIPVFHYSLKPSGLLFLGPAESVGGFTEMFSAVDPKWKLFARKEGTNLVGKILDFPFHVNKQAMTLSSPEAPGTGRRKTSIAESFNKILLAYFTPASILINEKGDILYINGKTNNYMNLPQGEAVMNVHRMIREELKYILGNLIHQAQSEKETVSVDDIVLKEGDMVRLVSMKATVLNDRPLQGLILVIFEDKGIRKKNSRRVKGLKMSNVEDLEKELVYTKLQLHSTIEQMETSLEELKSTNEELQSTNEESLTTKEEMQSLNEELMTINTQYQAKTLELTQLNNDMKNLLDATEIGTIFLDNNLNILRFTPQVKKLFNLIPSDIGRSITHIVSNFDRPLENIIKKVIDRLISEETEVKTKTNEWYSVRIMPYRTLENFISGAVITFTAITTYKQMAFKLSTLQQYSAGVVQALKEPAIQLDKDLNVVTANTFFLNHFSIREQDILEVNFLEFAADYWAISKERLAALCRSQTNERLRVEPVNKKGAGIKPFEINIQPFTSSETTETLMVLIIVDSIDIS
jgi:two-component system CheB/CheR fusion protein